MTASSEIQFYLASASPRRREILSNLGLHFDLLSSDIDETPDYEEKPEQYVSRLAKEKAIEGIKNIPVRNKSLPVMGADTCVVCDNQILGKPVDLADASNMLRQLSGKWHIVMSAVCLIHEKKEEACLSVTRVKFRELSEEEIQAYCLSGEPKDKAGSYAIQGLAAIFIERLEGSYSGVVGLPIFETAQLLEKFGITPTPN